MLPPAVAASSSRSPIGNIKRHQPYIPLLAVTSHYHRYIERLFLEHTDFIEFRIGLIISNLQRLESFRRSAKAAKRAEQYAGVRPFIASVATCGISRILGCGGDRRDAFVIYVKGAP